MVLALAVPSLVLAIEVALRLWSGSVDVVNLVAEARLALLRMLAVAAAFGGAASVLTVALALTGRPVRTRGLRVAAVLATITLLGGLAAAWVPLRQPQTTRPDILLIVVDTLRADFVDEERTPHVAKLGDEGVVFSNAHSAAPWTLPSFGTIFTGRFPRDHRAGLLDRQRGLMGTIRTPLRDDVPTLAEVLSAAGYQTVGLASNANLHPETGLGRGFEAYRSLTRSSAVLMATFPLNDQFSFVDADAQASRALTWLAFRDPHRPLFLMLHFMDPHRPRRPTSSLLDRETAARGTSGVVAEYGATVRAVDDAVGRVLEALRRAGRLDRTLVVFTSDHGEGLEPGTERIDHGNTLFPDVIRTPLVIRLPGGRRAGEVCAPVCSNVDLAATILAAADLSASLGVGRPLLDGIGRCAREHDIAFFGATSVGPPRDGLASDEIAIIWTHPDTLEAFDPVRDPEYRAPLPTNPGPWVDLLRRHVAELQTAASTFDHPAPVELRPEVVEELRELGYVH